MADTQKYEMQIVGWKIEIDRDLFDTLRSRVRGNEEISPEMVGYLIGLAEPILTPKECFLCKRSIVKGLLHETDINIDDPFRYKSVHELCYQNAIKKNTPQE